MMKKLLGATAILAASLSFNANASDVNVQEVFKEHCASCHGLNRYGAIGPALLPENLKRLRKKKAVGVIKNGRAATQMPAFGEQLNEAEITALVEFIYTPLDKLPTWDMGQMKETHEVHVIPSRLPGKPVFDADPLNLFTVVETGDHSVTILDGDKFEPLWRFKSRFALHGGAKYSPDGRFVYLGSRDGWVSKYDLYTLQLVAEIRVAVNMRNIAVSSDGKWVIAGNYLPHSLVILEAETLEPVKYIDVSDGNGNSSRVSAVYNAPPRQSFIAALKDMKEVWEITYDPDADPKYGAFVHDYRGKEKDVEVTQTGTLSYKRIELDDYLDDFFFDQDYINVFGASRDGVHGVAYNLDAGKKIANLDLAGMPHLGSGITWNYKGTPVMATPHLKEGKISVIDMESWDTIKTIKTKGPGFFMRSHENTPYAWTDVFFGKDRDLLHIIDKRTLEIVKTINPQPGKTNAHVEFTRDGKYALVSVWDMDGALVVYDAETFEEVKRIPMKNPVGKYNVWNKISYSAGTSH
ncbi:cytochrome c [Terasakiella brassicae]|uniref:Cytochrome c n=1 Tax=Terasakiella brassicae TaxID=1634917 RepID=A0A917C4N4_9PROT|nr:nitrite reductase [Terasakiella brassicae]GGF71676.1 cytochrome c [Terasakiella brassicae]